MNVTERYSIDYRATAANRKSKIGWSVFDRTTGVAVEQGIATEELARQRAEQRQAALDGLAAAAKAEAEKAEENTGRNTNYREVTSPIYGRGRRYADQPGATQYDDGSGRYSVQIWDES